MLYQVGTQLSINGLEGKVIGYIQYQNLNDGNQEWTEYRLMTSRGECWLSCDEVYDEYSISWPANSVRGQIGPEWHKVDAGVQVVRSASGNVDVDRGERASFVEYEDATEDHTLSVEMWSDGTEYSKGEYIERTDIIVKGYSAPRSNSPNSSLSKLFVAVIALFVICNFVVPIFSFISMFNFSDPKISDYLNDSSQYTYETSITGNEQQKATVYKYSYNTTTDSVAKDIIDGIEGNTQSVTQKDNTEDSEIGILTSKEYCLIYHPEGEENVVYVQVSDRKYNYTSDQSPYRCSSATTNWYRSHYYSAGYTSDASSYSSASSAYDMYDGATIHNIGNGYFDSYSNSVRQSSVNTRNSSSGGVSSGK